MPNIVIYLCKQLLKISMNHTGNQFSTVFFSCCLPISSHIQLKLEKLLFMFPLLGGVATEYLL